MDIKALGEELIAINKKVIAMTGRECASIYFEADIFEQTWGNTSGPHEGWGGSAMTTLPVIFLKGKEGVKLHLLFFSAELGYAITKGSSGEALFLKDVEDRNVAGMESYKKRYGKGVEDVKVEKDI